VRIMSTLESNNSAHFVASRYHTALHHLLMREYDQADRLAAQALSAAERHEIQNYIILGRSALGTARAQLGRIAEGIALLREDMAGMLEHGIRAGATICSVWLAEAQAREGASANAVQTVEQALDANVDELIFRPEALRVRGELRAKQGGNSRSGRDRFPRRYHTRAKNEREDVGAARNNEPCSAPRSARPTR
jgi:hypothetical protein